ncbi:hypothetical protein Trydic_g6335 [Trypoxylus dichotomus]
MAKNCPHAENPPKSIFQENSLRDASNIFASASNEMFTLRSRWPRFILKVTESHERTRFGLLVDITGKTGALMLDSEKSLDLSKTRCLAQIFSLHVLVPVEFRKLKERF